MDKIQIRKRRDEMVDRWSSWFGCIHLGEDIYTNDDLHLDTRVRQCLQIVSDIICKPLDKIRVLDLACLEGHFGIEFALHGAEVLGIEGREVNLQKAEFVRDILSLNSFKLVHGDVRNLTREQYGEFDVVLCLGILYHMDTPEAMHFVKSVFELCSRVAIIDTHFSLTDAESYRWNGNLYWGHYYKEHEATEAESEQLTKLWSSIGNVRSFVLTRPSLYNLLRHVGFTSVYECINPYRYFYPGHPAWPVSRADDQHGVLEDRTTFVAIKGTMAKVMSSPLAEQLPEINRPGKPPYMTPPTALFDARSRLARKLRAYLPEPARKALSSLYHSVSGH